MTLSRTAKVVVGALTALVALLPVCLILAWLTMVLGIFQDTSRESVFFQTLDTAFPFVFAAGCLFNVLIYGMMAFYIAHAIKNLEGSDVVRIVGLLLVFFFPYLGMPAYYIVYILMSKPPAWAMKPQPPAISSHVGSAA
jgi:hypothetical protein